MSLKSFSSYLFNRLMDNITNDYFDIILVSSRSVGLIKGARRPYRIGKSTFALWLSYYSHKAFYDFYGIEYDPGKLWNDVFDHLFYSIYDVDKYVKKLAKKGKTAPAIVLDEAERSAPALRVIPPELAEAIYNINTYGTQIKFLVLTAPSMKSLARPLRELVTIEIIIPMRGKYEIQEIVIEKNYYNAPHEYGRYIYRQDGTFIPLPPPIEKRYQEWRRKLPAMKSKADKGKKQEVPRNYIQASKLAKILGVSRHKIYRLCEKGEIKCLSNGRFKYIDINDIELIRSLLMEQIMDEE